MPFSDSFASSILNSMMAKNANLTFPESVFIGLTSNDPEADNGRITELSGSGYSRVLISRKGDEYPDVIGSAYGRTISNSKQVNWSKATGNWPTVYGFFLTSSKSGGSPFFYGKLETPVVVESGHVALFDPGSFSISFPAQDTSVASATSE